METEKPWWWDRYHKPWSKEKEEFERENANKIFTVEKTMNWTDTYDSETKCEPNTRKVTFSGKGIQKTTFTETF